jgi:hypothetical protein
MWPRKGAVRVRHSPNLAKEVRMKRTARITGLVIAVLVLSACVAGSAEAQHAAAGGVLSQFLLGFWHGVIAPVTLIVEIINKLAPHALPWTLRLYESTNTGVAYDAGFYLGLAGGPPIVFTSWSRRR